ncbi:MAG: alanine racemase [Candidatus Omnitrophota bacterium]
MFYRPTWAEIDLGNIAYNLRLLRGVVGRKTRILVTVKADAYGHGILPVSRKLVSCGVGYLGVASIDEALAIRGAGIKCDILVLGGALPWGAKTIVERGLVSAVFDLQSAKALNAAAKRRNKKARVHIKVDTGMGRLGVWCNQALGFIREVSGFKSLDIEGIFTHLAYADSNRSLTQKQIALFERLIGDLGRNGLNIRWRHIANSLGILDFAHSDFNLVRPGIVIYGLCPRANIPLRFRPALSLKSKIVSLKAAPAGQRISYGGSYVTRRKTLIATVPIGYGDGYPRALSNMARVLINGRKVKVAGMVCMDYIMLDLGRMRGVKCGDTVTLIGEDRGKAITAEELAGVAGTICY